MSSPATARRLLCSMFLIFLTQLLLFSTSLSSGDDTPTVYQVLVEYGFPVGILPKGATRYQLDRSTGRFAVQLDETCSFTVDGYNLRYSSSVTGVISRQRITSLSGVQVKILFFWLNIVEVSVNGDEVDFSVGIASTGFAVDNFYESPQCGCGFDCVNGEFGSKHHVSSSSLSS